MTDLDARIFLAVHHALSGRVVLAIMVVLTIVGSGWTMFAFLPLLVLERTRRFAIALLSVLTSTALAVFVLKHIVSRTRPYLVLADVHARVFAPPTDFSFPSGHSAGAFAFASFAALVLLRIDRNPGRSLRSFGGSRVLGAAALFATATGIALSRIALGVHFPGDVAAGAVLGSAFGGTGAILYLRHLRRRAVTEAPSVD